MLKVRVVVLPKSTETKSRSSGLDPDVGYGHCCTRLCLPIGDDDPEHPAHGMLLIEQESPVGREGLWWDGV